MQHSHAPVDTVSVDWRRRIAFIALALAASTLLYFVVSLVQVWNTGRDDSFLQSRSTVDAIVVLGAAQYDGRPSPQLRARLDHVVRLWNMPVAPTVVVTGGKQTGDRFTEAEASRDYLVSRGLPVEVIVIESRGESTYQSLEAVRDAARANQWRRLVLVSDPYHLKRAQLVAEELGMDAEVSATRDGVVSGSGALRRNVREALGIMVGRITGFRQLESWLQ
ncbi:MAG: YdcF family protein [Ilumatobacteraceae bacterium]